MSIGELEAEWHPTMNLPLLFEPSLPVSKKLWWNAKCGHKVQSSITDRLKGVCSYCSSKKILIGFNDLASQNPELAAQWHPTKNILSPTEITSKNSKKVWWLGTCGHEWISSIRSRTNPKTQGSGCYYCGGNRVLEGFNDLASQNPSLAAQWHPTKNGKILPNEINAKSGKKYWWLGECGHEWESQLSNRDNGAGCSVCSGKTVLIGFNDLASQNPELASQWHPSKNGVITPDQITLTTSKKVWWICSEAHEWEVSPNGRRSGSGCPYCSGNKVMTGFNDLATVSPAIASQWHPIKNNDLTPQQVTKGSKRKVWWLCSKGHEWEVMVTERNYSNCPICSGHKVLAGFNDLATLNPILAAQWHPTKNGKLTPSAITKSSGQKIWWLCDNNHEWLALGSDRSNGSGCPNCANHVSKAEEQIKEFLEGFDLIVEGSNRVILGDRREIDLWVPEKYVGIEFNGIYWHKEKYRGQNFHHDKYLAAKKAGIQLIQIWEDDWKRNPELVKRILAQKLGVAEQVPAKDTNVITITEAHAKAFLNENHLQRHATGTHYLGLVSNGDIETLQAVMVLEEEPGTDGKNLNIVRFATRANIVGGFTKLLDYVKDNYHSEFLTALADHCMADGVLYEDNEFIAEQSFPADYMYVVKNERKPRSEYPVEGFRDDPTLVWEEGLTAMELADLNGLDRIWDAGKTNYRLVL